MMGTNILRLYSYPSNGYGLYDMAGNVWEWCLDAYDADFYSNSLRRNPIAGAASISDVVNNYTNVKYSRVLRGGSWVNYAQERAGRFPRQGTIQRYVQQLRFSLCEDCNTLTYFTSLPLSIRLRIGPYKFNV